MKKMVYKIVKVENVKVELDLSNYETKIDLKGATRIVTSNVALK